MEELFQTRSLAVATTLAAGSTPSTAHMIAATKAEKASRAIHDSIVDISVAESDAEYGNSVIKDALAHT
ncbi:hypothetical protein BH10PSE19_BH10PSE19_12720 [soil metagenome]